MQKVSLVKSKFGKPLGYRTPDNFRSRGFGKSKAGMVKYDPARFKTQHKG